MILNLKPKGLSGRTNIKLMFGTEWYILSSEDTHVSLLVTCRDFIKASEKEKIF